MKVKVRLVQLEILRRGLQYRQLLSPANQYEALSGNHEAVSVTAPFEHYDLLQRVRALRYEGDGGEAARREAIRRTGVDTANMLGQIPGLLHDLAIRRGEESELTHLRMVLSAPELALLPFELAFSPQGFPGAAQELSLQFSAPLALIRGVRRVTAQGANWNRSPRVLFAAASPPGVREVPLDAHLLVLREALDSWIAGNAGDRLQVLKDASLDEIQAACQRHEFTHVHILAHGAPLDRGEKFGVMLWDRTKTGADVVDGVRLAMALRTHRATESEVIAPGADAMLSSPLVVSLATCDSGNDGDIVTPGSSMAHTLHERGVPMVVASQFPLTMAGSVILARELYARLFWGEDPRLALHAARQELRRNGILDHDWASLIVYAAFPLNLEEQLRALAWRQSRDALQCSMSKAWRKRGPSEGAAATAESVASVLDLEENEYTSLDTKEANARVQEADSVIARMRRLVAEDSPASKSEGYGMVGASYKRVAALHFRHALHVRIENPGAAASQSQEAEQALARARDAYQKAFLADLAAEWAGVQYLVLSVVLGTVRECPREHWDVALASAALHAKSSDSKHRAWALASQLELTLIRPPIAGPKRPELANVPRLIAEFRACASAEEILSLRRQLNRWKNWWTHPESGLRQAETLSSGPIRERAERILTELPDAPAKGNP